jgi:hypothetical protein
MSHNHTATGSPEHTLTISSSLPHQAIDPPSLSNTHTLSLSHIHTHTHSHTHTHFHSVRSAAKTDHDVEEEEEEEEEEVPCTDPLRWFGVFTPQA